MQISNRYILFFFAWYASLCQWKNLTQHDLDLYSPAAYNDIRKRRRFLHKQYALHRLIEWISTARSANVTALTLEGAYTACFLAKQTGNARISNLPTTEAARKLCAANCIAVFRISSYMVCNFINRSISLLIHSSYNIINLRFLHPRLFYMDTLSNNSPTISVKLPVLFKPIGQDSLYFYFRNK